MDSKRHGEKRLHGNLAVWDEAIQKPSVGTFVEVAIGHTVDVLAGVVAGSGLGEAMTDPTAGADGCGADTITVTDGCGADTITVTDACGADTITVTDASGGVDPGGVDMPQIGENHEPLLSVETPGGVDPGGVDIPQFVESQGPLQSVGLADLPFVGDEIQFLYDHKVPDDLKVRGNQGCRIRIRVHGSSQGLPLQLRASRSTC